MKPNPLFIVAAIFAASFGGRAVSLASDAMKAPEKPARAAPAKVAAEEKSDGAHDPVSAAPADKAAEAAKPAATPVDGVDRSALLVAIRERSARLDAREAEIAERARLLEIAEKRIEAKTDELKSIKSELESRLVYAETAVQKDLAQLAKMYESMKPAKAGEIFNAMDPSFAAGFLTEMNSESAALILANMQTEKAYAASVIIAGRNAAVNRR